MADNSRKAAQIKPLTNQSIEIFQLLIRDGALSTNAIARKLGIRQQNVRRGVQPLIDRRMVLHGNAAIIEHYAARPLTMASNAYIRYARAEFERLFGQAYNETKHKRMQA